jgi:signal transduction histidine kinase/DNA-binding response OmpR family regulator
MSAEYRFKDGAAPLAVPTVAKNHAFDFLAGGGEMEQLVRTHDWSKTPLGPPEHWSISLRMMVSFLLANRFPLLLWWGPDYISIYNDAYRPVLGTKHPWALGQPFRECWAEIRDVIEPLIDAPFNGGPATWMDDIVLEINRYGFLEETHFTVAYSPVPDETAPRGIGGVLATVHEITEKIIGERRLAVLRDLGAHSGDANSAEEACAIAATALAGHPRDVPFALIYLVEADGKRAKLAGASGVTAGESAAPLRIELAPTGDSAVWPLTEALRSGTSVAVSGIFDRLAQVPSGPWSDPPSRAVVVPMRSNSGHQVTAFLIAGVSSRLRLDDQYLSFLDLIAAHVATAITNARAYDDERRRAQALAELDRAKTLFFSNISHELRTPLTLMLGPIAEAAANPATTAQVRSQLELAHRNSLRLLKLVNTLLEFSRIEAGRVQAWYEPTDLAALTCDLASTFRAAIEQAGLTFVVDCCRLDEPVYVDREMWEKIVLNLLSNAFKYTFTGSVTVKLLRGGQSAVLEVIDTGVGVPKDELPRLFERFHRVEGTMGRTLEGSGIGLALVQELVKLHCGMISVSSVLKCGTTFRVELPLGTAHLPAERIRPANSATVFGSGAHAFVKEALRWTPDSDGVPSIRSEVLEDQRTEPDSRFAETAGARILLADDNADMRTYVRDLLSPLYQVEAVEDGVQALASARRHKPELIVSDVMMPHLDGLGLLKALRSDALLRDVPVIMLSARAGEEARIGGLDAGADDYLVKPFSARELLARVGALLELIHLRRASDTQFRAFVNATSDVVYRMSADTSEIRFLQGEKFVDSAVESSSEWLKKYIHPDDEPRLRSRIREAISIRGVIEMEHRVRRADGSFRWVFSRAIPVLDEKGQIVEWLGAASDVTERKGEEERLQGQRRILENIAAGGALDDTLNDLLRFLEAQQPGVRCCLLIVSDDGRCFSRVCGPSFAGGFSDAITGLPIASADSGSCGRAVADCEPVVVADVNAEQRFSSAWREVMLAHGVRAARSTPVRGADGRVLATLALCFDRPCDPTPSHPQLIEIGSHLAAIALERSRTEAAEREARRALQTADRQKDEFLAMLAHELRNPLAPIRNASEILARLLPQQSSAQTHVGMVKRQTRQLMRLVDDLLDVSRITQGRIELHRQPIDLASVVAQAVETVEPQLREKQHRLIMTSSAGYEPLYVSGDFARLVQCVVNVLSNAAKYTDPSGEITVRTRAERSVAVIEITDSGVGISPELLPQIFELFVQSARTLDRAQGGLGIGLAVVKRLVEMHGGRVTASSRGIGHGATVAIHLPRIDRPVAAAADPAEVATSPRRILIVDDNRDAADSLAVLLSLRGHETTALYSGREALERIQAIKPDVALLDIGLPEMDGYALAQQLRAMPQLNGIRLVAITGYGQAEDQLRTRKMGFDDHLVKPVDIKALERTLSGAGKFARLM